MLKKFLDWVLTINLIVITAIGLFLWWTGNLTVNVGNPDFMVDTAELDPEAVLIFSRTIREEVDRQLGQPPELYTPELFTDVFPGIVATDFEDVEASQGKYVVVDGQLVHVPPPNTGLHSAATAITTRGYRTLLENIAIRSQINLAESGTLTEVMDAISQQ